MLKFFTNKVKLLSGILRKTFRQFKNQYAYELKAIAPCQITDKHRVQVKIMGKGQSLHFYPEEIAADNNFLLGFCPTDIRTIVYLATSDKYEAILREEKLKKTLEFMRAKNKDGNKAIQLRDKATGKIFIKTLKDFNDNTIIDKLSSHEAYNIGYLAGQEQAWATSVRFKLITSEKNNLDQHE